VLAAEYRTALERVPIEEIQKAAKGFEARTPRQNRAPAASRAP